MIEQPLPHFCLRIQVFASFSQSDAVISKIRATTEINARLLLEGEWYRSSEGILLPCNATWSPRKLFRLNVDDSTNSCLFHHDFSRARQLALEGGKANLAWWSMYIRDEGEPEILFRLCCDLKGNLLLLRIAVP